MRKLGISIHLNISVLRDSDEPEQAFRDPYSHGDPDEQVISISFKELVVMIVDAAQDYSGEGRMHDEEQVVAAGQEDGDRCSDEDTNREKCL